MPNWYNFRESRQSLLQCVAEESPDFARRDASETLGAERLRKVQQKTHRVPNGYDRLKMAALGAVPFLETERSCKPHLKQEVYSLICFLAWRMATIA